MGTSVELFENKNRVSLIANMEAAIEQLAKDCRMRSNELTIVSNLIIQKIKNNEGNHNLSFSSDKTTPGNVAFDDGKDEKTKKRVPQSLGRYVRRHLNVTIEQLSDVALDTFVKETIKYLDISEKIEIISGPRIEEQYKDTSKVSTCMGGPSNCIKVRLYAENPEKVKMVLFDKGTLRALLWTADDGQVILDRIYPDGHSYCQAIRNWAKSQGFILKATQGTGEFRLSDSSIRYITLKRPSNGRYPYVDTFQNGKIDGDNIILSNSREKGHNVPLSSTSGVINIPINCKECGASISSQNLNDYKTLEDGTILCNACYSKRFVECELCNKIIKKENAKVINEMTFSCEACFEHSGACACCGFLSLKLVNGKDMFSKVALDNGGTALYCADFCTIPSKNICRHCGTYEKDPAKMVVIGRKRYCKNCSETVTKLVAKLVKQNAKNAEPEAPTTVAPEAATVVIETPTPPAAPPPVNNTENQ